MFHVTEQTLNTVSSLRNGPFEWSTDKILDGCQLVVVDDYSKDALTESPLRQHANMVMAIDDLANRSHDCDLLLDPTIGRNPQDYDRWVSHTCRYLLGSDYALLRPEFRRLRHQAVQREYINHVLIAPGQTDPHNLAFLASDAVRRSLPSAEISIVLGSSAPHLDTVREASQGVANLFVDVDADTMGELMVQSDLAIGAPGGSCWERCALGLPSLLVIVADNQRLNAEGLTLAGAARTVGEISETDTDALTSAIEALSNKPDDLATMSRNAFAVCDGRGTFRASTGVVPERILREGSPIHLRAAEKSDAKVLHDWQSDPSTRKYARTPEIPSWDRHVVWLDDKLEDDSCLFCVVEKKEDSAVGYFRLDEIDNGYEISIATAPEARHTGIATAALQMARDLLPVSDIFAYIKPENEASMKLFRSAGYMPAGNGYFVQTAGNG